MRYAVLDGLGNLLKKFKTFRGAMTFKIANNRYDWKIVEL